MINSEYVRLCIVLLSSNTHADQTFSNLINQSLNCNSAFWLTQLPYTIMNNKDILVIQQGEVANYTGAHFWNFEVRAIDLQVDRLLSI